jgi:5-methylcytosine-specific restriction endonuclease McrA
MKICHKHGLHTGGPCPACKQNSQRTYDNPAYRRLRAHLLNGSTPCEVCGTFRDLTVDHIKPVWAGGGNSPSNLRVLCRSCNSRKGVNSR